MIKTRKYIRVSYDSSVKIYRAVMLYKFKNWNMLLKTKMDI